MTIADLAAKLAGAIFGSPREQAYTSAATSGGSAPTTIAIPSSTIAAIVPTTTSPQRQTLGVKPVPAASPQRQTLGAQPVSFSPGGVTGGGPVIQSTHNVNFAKAASNATQSLSQVINPSSIGGGPAGANAAAVLATEIPAGHLSLATQLGGGNPGLPEVGSLMYQDLVNRGLIKQGQ